MMSDPRFDFNQKGGIKTAMVAPRINCSICRDDDLYKRVNDLLARSMPYKTLRDLLQEKREETGIYASVPTIRRHHMHMMALRGVSPFRIKNATMRKGQNEMLFGMAEIRAGVGIPDEAPEPVPELAQPDPEPVPEPAAVEPFDGVRRPLSAGVITIEMPADYSDADLAQLIVETAAKGVVEGKLGVTVKDGLAAQAILERRAEREQGQELLLKLARLLAGAHPAEIVEGEYREVSLLAPPDRRGDLAGLVVELPAIAEEPEEPLGDDDAEPEPIATG